MIQITLALECVPGGQAEAPPKSCPSGSGREGPCPGAQRDAGCSDGLHPHADLHPRELHFLFIKRTGSKRPMTTLSSPFLYLNISKHLAKTFIFSLPQGEEVIWENGTNIPICQKQEGSELKGKFYHLTEQNQPRRDCEGLFRLPIHPICFHQCNFRSLITEKTARGPNQVPILLRINHSPVAPAQETLPPCPGSPPKPYSLMIIIMQNARI